VFLPRTGKMHDQLVIFEIAIQYTGYSSRHMALMTSCHRSVSNAVLTSAAAVALNYTQLNQRCVGLASNTDTTGARRAHQA
jgi:hypothetical protein